MCSQSGVNLTDTVCFIYHLRASKLPLLTWTQTNKPVPPPQQEMSLVLGVKMPRQYQHTNSLRGRSTPENQQSKGIFKELFNVKAVLPLTPKIPQEFSCFRQTFVTFGEAIQYGPVGLTLNQDRAYYITGKEEMEEGGQVRSAETTMAALDANDDVGKLQDTSLWLSIEAKGMPKLSEFDIVEALYDSVTSELGQGSVNPEDILGAQFLAKQRTWLINFACEDAKAKAISIGRIVVHNKSFAILDFQRAGLKEKQVRISIHGIPHHISDSEVAQWVDTKADRSTAVMRHQKKNRNSDSPFRHLYSGHRFCYVSKIRESFPRYTTYSIPDPMDVNSLMDVEVTIFHDGQKANCKSCKADDHVFSDCPHRVTCHNCGKKGHIRKWCRAEKKDASNETNRSIEQQVEAQLKAVRRKVVVCPTSSETTREDDNQTKFLNLKMTVLTIKVVSRDDVTSSCRDESRDAASGISVTPRVQQDDQSGWTQQNRRRLRSSRRTTTSKRKDVLTPPQTNKPGKLHKDEQQQRQKDNG
ncbi:hypothetical protein Bbelb_424280 [Branchiostoma belcheri]|nr:hypothetical protein Bbelb_424280 [Branchiostoma belcheri]